MASHRRGILGSVFLKGVTGPNIFSIDSLVNPNCLSILILFAVVDCVCRSTGQLVSRSLNYEVEVHLPVVAKAVVSVALDFPSTRIAGRLGVSASDTDIDVLDGYIPHPVVLR